MSTDRPVLKVGLEATAPPAAALAWQSQGTQVGNAADVSVVAAACEAGQVPKADGTCSACSGVQVADFIAAADCRNLTSLVVGDLVKVIADKPRYGWGKLHKGEVGQVVSFNSDGEPIVDFRSVTGWHGHCPDLQKVGSTGGILLDLTPKGTPEEPLTRPNIWGLKETKKSWRARKILLLILSIAMLIVFISSAQEGDSALWSWAT